MANPRLGARTGGVKGWRGGAGRFGVPGESIREGEFGARLLDLTVGGDADRGYAWQAYR